MIIQEDDFQLENEGNNSWTLKLLTGGKNPDWKAVAYCSSLESCIKRIINIRLAEKRDTYTLKQYLAEYKNEIGKLEKLFKDL